MHFFVPVVQSIHCPEFVGAQCWVIDNMVVLWQCQGTSVSFFYVLSNLNQPEEANSDPHCFSAQTGIYCCIRDASHFPYNMKKNHGQKMNNDQFGFNDTLNSNTCLILHHWNVKTSTIDIPQQQKSANWPDLGLCDSWVWTLLSHLNNNGRRLYVSLGNLFLGKKNISTFIFFLMAILLSK